MVAIVNGRARRPQGCGGDVIQPNDRAKPAVGLGRHRVEFVSQPEVELQARRDTDVILKVKGQIGESYAEIGFGGLIEERDGTVVEQVGDRIEKVHAARNWLKIGIVLHAPDPKAELEVVPPVDVRDVVFETEQVVVLELGGTGRFSKGQAEDINAWQDSVARRIQRDRLGPAEVVGRANRTIGAAHESESRLVEELRSGAVHFRETYALQPGAVAGKCVEIELAKHT